MAKEFRMNIDQDLQQEFEDVIQAAYRLSEDIGKQVEDVLRAGAEEPLRWDDAERLLSRVVEVLKRAAQQRGDVPAQESLEGEINELVQKIARTRDEIAPSTPQAPKRLELTPFNGIRTGKVSPRPCFHGREVV